MHMNPPSPTQYTPGVYIKCNVMPPNGGCMDLLIAIFMAVCIPSVRAELSVPHSSIRSISGYFDPTTEIRGPEYKFVQPEVPFAEPVPNPQPRPKSAGALQSSRHHNCNVQSEMLLNRHLHCEQEKTIWGPLSCFLICVIPLLSGGGGG